MSSYMLRQSLNAQHTFSTVKSLSMYVSDAHLVHDVSGEVCIAEGNDAVLDQAPALVEVLARADLLLQACRQEGQQQ